MQTEVTAATEDAATQPLYRGPPRSPANAPVPEPNRSPAPHRPQRVRTVRLTTQVHPDVLVPYLYGERGGRSGINAIVNATGCTVDYCALSPDESERSPQSRAFVMNFLVSATSSETLEDATRQLRTLVDRVQVYLMKKRAARGQVDDGRTFERRKEAVTESTREPMPLDERWMDIQDEDWDAPPMQRVYYAAGGAPRARRPRYVELDDVDADEKSEFVMPGRRDAVEMEAAYRGQSPSHFVTRRRVRRYPDHSRWMPRNYARGETGYAMYAAASPQRGNEQGQRISRPRQPRHIYPETGKQFAQECRAYEYDDTEDENDVEVSGFEEGNDLTNENAGASENPEFGKVPDQGEPVHRTHPRRSRKRPLSMRTDGLLPPQTIYRQRVPYIYDYEYDDEDDEWMTEDEEMAVAYGYAPQFRPMEIPVVRRRRRFDSVSSQHWGSPAGHGHPQVYKRRKIPRGALPLEHDMAEDPGFELPIVHSRASAHTRTALMDQLNEVAESVTSDTFRENDDNHVETARVPADDGSTEEAPSAVPHSDTVPLDGGNEGCSSPSELSRVVAPGEVPDEQTSNTLPQGSIAQNNELAQSTNDKTDARDELHQSTSIERVSQSEIVPLDPSATMQEAASFMSPPVTASSPVTSRKTPESRVASPPPSAANDASHIGPSHAETVMDVDAERSSQLVSSDRSILPESDLPVRQSALTETTGQQDSGSGDAHLFHPTAEAASPVENVATDMIRINNHVISSLERANRVEADFVLAKTSLSEQENKFRHLENRSNCHLRLEALCGIVYDLQYQIGSNSCGLDEFRKQDLLDKLDIYLENIITESERTLQEKVDMLQSGLEHVLTMDGFIFHNQEIHTKEKASKLVDVRNGKPCTTSPTAIEDNHDAVDAVDMDWEDDGWFDESAPVEPASESEDQDFVAQISPTKSNLKLEGDFLAVKLEEGTSPRWPQELPPFVWSLLARVISSDPQSYVMRVTHRRLMDEIAKGDPYYYLHPTIMPKEAEVSAPVRTSSSHPCEFGCRGASALKWERKLVSQISSRMKSFDNVAYSLARSSGGKEVLNRKKMNSIIRKLHLVAMQLHSLVSHLYCVKGQATCKEVDSLPIALNNSHFERKMGVYKSRLKLVVPHKYQQQQTQQQSNTNEPMEELLRDTYEFFPELLLCVDIWGYNYRESQAKRQTSKSVLGDKLAGPGVVSEGALFPLGFFRGVENLAFDYELDNNRRLRHICDELLNIVCLWNDFKWTDNLEAVALERVVSFEKDVTTSILKILELYAHHLQALWAVRLLDEPEQLRSIHFTQLNAYYSDRSRGSLNTTSGSQPRAPRLSKIAANGANAAVDELVANEIVEERLAEEYWNRKVTALSIHNPDDDELMEVDGAAPMPSQLLSADAIGSWDQQRLVSYLLRWSDVYAIRSEVTALSSVTNHMLKHEVQKSNFGSRGDNGTNANKVMVDPATRQLLAAVSRAQMLIRDALTGTEKLALHSASNQIQDERKHPGAEREVNEASEAAQVTSPSSKSAENTPSGQNTAKDTHAQAEDAVSEPELPPHTDNAPSTLNTCVQETATFETGNDAPEQPELKDLIQLLAVTKQDMQELCGHRPRSARMREKVQTQSVQLARQTVEIFRNIKNMYASQHR